jgi:catechol 2,3-dioxygenase-like lactoylglutathione lyase family enzyme
MLKRIHHVGIVVKSLDDAYRFYRDVLGLHVHKTAEVRDRCARGAAHGRPLQIELLEPIDLKGR